MDQKIDDIFLERFLSGACTDAEKKQVNTYLRTASGYAHLESFMKLQWDKTCQGALSEEELASWRKEFLQKMHIEKSVDYSGQRRPKTFHFFLRYVAAAVLLVVGGFAFYISFREENISSQKSLSFESLVQENRAGQRSWLTLTDGSRILLGPSSKIIYPKHFDDQSREIELVGEAFFDIAKDPSKPFIIHTGNIQTRVLGTSFHIHAFPKTPIKVSVVTGKVRVDKKMASGEMLSLATLTPGQQTLCNINQDHAVTTKFDIYQVEEWKNGHLVFNGTPFYQLLESVERWYDKKFVVQDDALKNIPVTMTLDAQVPLTELMNGLSAVMGTTYNITADKVIIKK